MANVECIDAQVRSNQRLEDRLAHANAVVRGIREVHRLITRERDARVLIQRACGALVAARGFEFAAIALTDGEVIRGSAHALLSGELPAVWGLVSRGELPSCFRTAIAAREPAWMVEGEGTCAGTLGALMAAPMSSGGKAFGVLALRPPKGEPADDEERSLLVELAADLGHALEAIETERQRDEALERLRASDARWRSLTESSIEGIAMHELVRDGLGRAVDYRILEVNLAFERHTGIEASRARGALASELYGSGEAPYLEQYARVVETGEPTRFEVRFEPLARDFRISVFALRPEGFATVFEDVTERRREQQALRRSAERWRATFDAIEDAIFVLSDEHEVEQVNAAGCKLLGLAHERIIGRKCYELVHATREPIAGCPWVRSKASHASESLVFEQGGRTYRASASPLSGLGDRGCVHVLRDITEDRLREAERALLEEKLRASQKLEAVGTLAGGVAHRFNNSLSTIINNARLAAEALTDDDPMRADLDEIVREGKSAAVLTQQLLAFSRRQVLKPQVLSMNAVLSGMGDMLRGFIGEDIDLVVQLDPEAGQIQADPSQLQQVVMNIAVNAREAMPSGGTLTIRTSNVNLDERQGSGRASIAPGAHVALTFTDTGEGMDEATRKRVFEPFFTTKPAGKGTGLGLSTVYGIVKQSGGEVTVQSEPGKGATFKLLFPAVEEAPASRRVSVSMSHSDRGTTGTETVLLVEDEEGVRSVARRILQRAGYRVLTAANGFEAILLCEQYPREVHLLVTDVVMPRMNGRELAERLTKKRPGLRVLYMSGYPDDEIVRRGVLEANMTLVNKPLSAEELTRAVRAALVSPR